MQKKKKEKKRKEKKRKEKKRKEKKRRFSLSICKSHVTILHGIQV
jgi:hypothetical protein